jgi:hypothetical protein
MKSITLAALIPFLLAGSAQASFPVGLALNNPKGGSYAEFAANSDNSCCTVSAYPYIIYTHLLQSRSTMASSKNTMTISVASRYPLAMGVYSSSPPSPPYAQGVEMLTRTKELWLHWQAQ